MIDTPGFGDSRGEIYDEFQLIYVSNWKIDTSAKNQKETMKLYTQLNDYVRRDIPIEKSWNSGYYALYCNYDDIVCQF